MDTNAARDAAAGGVVLDFDIHDRLRKARAHYSTTISQDAFAELIGASGNTVGNYETGATTRLKDVYIRNWASVTGVDYWWLKTGQTPDTKKAPTPKGEGQTLPGLDSNQQPAGYKPLLRPDFTRPRTPRHRPAGTVTFVDFQKRCRDSFGTPTTIGDGRQRYTSNTLAVL